VVLFFLVVLACQSVSAYTAGYSFAVTQYGGYNQYRYSTIALGNTNLNTDVTVGLYRTSQSDGVLFVPLSAITNNVVTIGFFLELVIFVEVQFNNVTLTLKQTNQWRAGTPLGGLTTVQPSTTSAYLAFSNTYTNSALSFNVTTQGGSCSGNYYEHTAQQSINGSVAYWTADLFNGLSTLTYNASFGFTKVDSQTMIIDSLTTNLGSSPSAVLQDSNKGYTLCGIDTYSDGTYVANGQANCLPFNQTTISDCSCTDPGISAGSELLCTGYGLLAQWLITFASNFAGCN